MSADTDIWPKNMYWCLLMPFFKISMFSSTTIRKEKVWQAIAKHLKNNAVNKSATQCDNKWKNLRELYKKTKE